MKFILAKKIGMTEMFDESGKSVGVTALEAAPIFVTQIKTRDKDGYSALQVGTGVKSRNNKAQIHHLSKVKIEGSDATKLRHLKEFRIEDNIDYKLGDKIDISVFVPGDRVTVQGVSKGRGFQGVVKRHGFHGGPKTHGNKHSLRAPGSIGATHPQHVIKGRKMAGRMGSDTVTTKNIKIFSVDTSNNLIFLQGAVSGRRGSLIKIIAK